MTTIQKTRGRLTPSGGPIDVPETAQNFSRGTKEFIFELIEMAVGAYAATKGLPNGDADLAASRGEEVWQWMLLMQRWMGARPNAEIAWVWGYHILQGELPSWFQRLDVSEDTAQSGTGDMLNPGFAGYTKEAGDSDLLRWWGTLINNKEPRQWFYPELGNSEVGPPHGIDKPYQYYSNGKELKMLATIKGDGWNTAWPVHVSVGCDICVATQNDDFNDINENFAFLRVWVHMISVEEGQEYNPIHLKEMIVMNQVNVSGVITINSGAEGPVGTDANNPMNLKFPLVDGREGPGGISAYTTESGTTKVEFYAGWKGPPLKGHSDPEDLDSYFISHKFSPQYTLLNVPLPIQKVQSMLKCNVELKASLDCVTSFENP